MMDPAMSGALAGVPDVAVDGRCGNWADALPRVDELCKRAAAEALKSAGVLPDGAEISIVLGDDALVRDLNQRWRGIDAATNVLAFPCSEDDAGDGGVRLLGDVVAAFETTHREAEIANRPLDHHLAHLIVHGVLHLLGYDHDTDDAADRMERLEIRALARLGIGDPYGDHMPGD